MKDNNFFYVLDVNIGAIWRNNELQHASRQSKGLGLETARYARELAQMFTVENAEDYPVCTVMSQEQLAKFLYLRDQSGMKNGIKELNMRRAKMVPPGAVDIRPKGVGDITVPIHCHVHVCGVELLSGEAAEAAEPQPTPVELAAEIQKVDEMLARIIYPGGTVEAVTFNVEGIELDADHMRQVLVIHRSKVRNKLMNLTAPSDAMKKVAK